MSPPVLTSVSYFLQVKSEKDGRQIHIENTTLYKVVQGHVMSIEEKSVLPLKVGEIFNF